LVKGLRRKSSDARAAPRPLDCARRAASRAICTRRGSPILISDAFNPRFAQAARRRVGLDFAVAAVAAVTLMAVAAFSAHVFIDGDTNWHVAAGRWILAHRLVPHTDPFSYTFAGKPWLAHEWLSEVLMALAWLALGWSGVVLLTGVAAGAAYAMIAAELRLWLAPPGQVVGLALSFACLAPFLYARPHILALPLLVFWTRGLLAARRGGRAPPLALAPLMLVWANLHASFILGLGLVGPFALEALVEAKDRRRALAHWATFGVAALGFSLATPNSYQGLIFPFRVLQMTILPSILEWRAANFQQLTPFEGVLLTTLFLGLWRGLKVPPLRLAIVVLLTHMALQHVRQQAVLAAVAPLLLAEPFGRALRGADAWRLAPALSWPDLRRWLPIPMALAVLAVAAVAGARLASPVVRRDNVNVPVSAMAHVPAAIARLPVFNEYAFGGYLIFKGVRPYIDGRADMYGDAFVREYLAVTTGAEPDVDRQFQRWGVRWTILSPRDRLVSLLEKSPNWRRLYADPFAVVDVAVGPTSAVAAPASPTRAAVQK